MYRNNILHLEARMKSIITALLLIVPVICSADCRLVDSGDRVEAICEDKPTPPPPAPRPATTYKTLSNGVAHQTAETLAEAERLNAEYKLTREKRFLEREKAELAAA